MSDRPGLEYLQPPVRSDGPIFLADVDPAWVSQYAREESRIRAALDGRAILIEHVGSTSVPELPAKPVIDIVLVVADSAAEATYVPDLEWPGTNCSSGSPISTSIACCAIMTRTFRSTCSPSEVLKWNGCCCSATGCAQFPRSAICINAPSVSSLTVSGNTFRTTRMRSHQWSKRSSRGLRQISRATLLRLKGLCHGGESRASQHSWP